jgi:signal peptidase II
MRGCVLNVRENRRKNTEPASGDACNGSGGMKLKSFCNSAAAEQKIRYSLKLPFLLSIAFIVTLADQLTKWIVVHTMSLHESIQIIPGIFSITRIHNSGIAFGLFPGIPDVFMVVTLLSMLIVIYFYLTVEPRTVALAVGCALILGGALGNLLDRFRLHYVVDFINFNFWPAFNIADSAVSIGVALLLLNFLLEKKGVAEDASHLA